MRNPHCSGQLRSKPEAVRQEALKRAEIGRNPNSSGRAVEARYGSFARYLEDGLGIDARELKQLEKDLLVG
ncbi:tyrosine-protein phosphatase [Streptomyces yangpuensis]|uniref:tyrosine-protein phosphatase n=1 Tax=Streptomyces yangpuensis TaxID=1648182 RepID=UPI00368C6932